MTEETINTTGGQAGCKRVSGMRVNVTAAIIETAIPENSSHCMIADAVKAAAVGKKMRISNVLVDLQSIRFTDRDTGKRWICWTPLQGQQAIQKFDAGTKPEPFTFRLKPVQVIEKTQRKQATRTGASKARVAFPHKTGGTPIKHGGRVIPTIGLRRVFGIRQLGMQQPQQEQQSSVEQS
jgi:hypothetical protein